MRIRDYKDTVVIFFNRCCISTRNIFFLNSIINVYTIFLFEQIGKRCLPSILVRQRQCLVCCCTVFIQANCDTFRTDSILIFIVIPCFSYRYRQLVYIMCIKQVELVIRCCITFYRIFRYCIDDFLTCLEFI